MEINITELIKVLEVIRRRHGDLTVVWDSHTHSFPPDPAIREEKDGRKVLVINS